MSRVDQMLEAMARKVLDVAGGVKGLSAMGRDLPDRSEGMSKAEFEQAVRAYLHAQADGEHPTAIGAAIALGIAYAAAHEALSVGVDLEEARLAEAEAGRSWRAN